MATKKPAPAKVSAWDSTFVRCEMDKATKDKVKNWDPKYEQTIDGLERMVMDGYKVSIAFDRYNDCVGVFCTIPEVTAGNHGWCLTARGPDTLAALKVLVFKHYTILDGVWTSEVSQAASKDAWG